MSVDQLQQFLGGNHNDYVDFLQRFQANPNAISNEEAARRYRELMSKLPPEAAAEVHSQVLAQLPPDERRQIAEQFERANNDPNQPFTGFDADDLDQAAQPRTLGVMSQRASTQDPDLFGQIFGPNSPLNGPLGKMLMSALVAYLAQRVLGGQSQQRGGPATGAQDNPIGDILGGLLGGQAGGTVPAGSGGVSGSGGLGDILGGLLGGQAGAGRTGTSGSGGLGDILGGLLGGQAGGSRADAGSAGGLDDVLGGLLGGQSGAQSGADQGGITSDAEADDNPKPRSHRRYK
jgi:hypothetical protein